MAKTRKEYEKTTTKQQQLIDTLAKREKRIAQQKAEIRQTRQSKFAALRAQAHKMANDSRKRDAITTIGFGEPRLQASAPNLLTPVRKADMRRGESALDAIYRINKETLQKQRDELKRIKNETDRVIWQREAELAQSRMPKVVQSKLMKRSNALGPYSYTPHFIGPRPLSHWGKTAATAIEL